MSLPIGLFDSGLGGLTVLKALLEVLPNENYIYIADNAFLPYGLRSRSSVQRLSYRLTGFLRGKGVKLVIVACNTAFGSLFPECEEEISVPIVGPIEAGVKEALLQSPCKRIGILATPGTIEGGYYQKILYGLEKEVSVLVQPAPKLVELVEGGYIKGDYTTKVVKEYLLPFQQQIDTLILGCTHFPFLLSTIKNEMSSEVRIIDPAVRLSQEVSSFLERKGLLNEEGEGKCCFFTTDRKRLSEDSLSMLKDYLSLPVLNFTPLAI